MSSGWNDFQGVNAALVAELYETVPARSGVRGRGDARFLRRESAAGRRPRHRPRSAGARAGHGRVEPDGTVRFAPDAAGAVGVQPRAVDSPLRTPRGADRSARRPAARRSDARARDARADRGRSRHAARRPHHRPGLGRRADDGRSRRAAADDLLLDDRLRPRAHLRPRRAPLVPRGDRERTLSRAGESDRRDRAARAAHAGRGLREVHPPRVSRQDAVLDRGARHARADPRRGDPGSRAKPGCARRSSAWRIAAG